MYTYLKPLFFLLDPELAHTVALRSLKLCYRLGLARFFKKIPAHPHVVMGLTFPNRIGLAAGLDKHADYIDALAALGFGFIEIGTVTPKPQAGNPKPRLFRLIKEEAIINRMGFNSKGADYVATQLEKINYRGILGVNIGKNKDTTNEHAIADYVTCFRKLWKYASYITINISSPNTPGLRDLQHQDQLVALLSSLKQEQKIIHDAHQRYIPLVVKIAPDLTTQALTDLANVLLQQKIDGVIATNTTLARTGIEKSDYAQEPGGLSGKPLGARSTEVIRELHQILQDQIPIIGSGGVMNAESVREKIAAGAQLVQVYTGLIYYGADLLLRMQ